MNRMNMYAREIYAREVTIQYKLCILALNAYNLLLLSC